MNSFIRKLLNLTMLFILSFLLVSCSKEKDIKEIYLPIIELASTGDKIYPTYYKNAFDNNYNNLPTLILSGNEDTLLIKLSEVFSKNFEIIEDYYKNTENGGFIEMGNYQLIKDNDNIVSFSINKRGTTENDFGIYYFKDDEVTYVFKVIYPLHKSKY